MFSVARNIHHIPHAQKLSKNLFFLPTLKQPSFYNKPALSTYFRHFQSFSEKDREGKNVKDQIYALSHRLQDQDALSRISLTNLKEIAKTVRPRWLDDDKIRKFFLSLHQFHFERLLKHTPEIFEFEKFLFLFHWGQIFLDFQKKDNVLRRYTDLLEKDENSQLDSRTIYTYCKTLNYLASICYSTSAELKGPLNILYNKISEFTSYDLYLMRAVIMVLNGIMLHEDLAPFTKHIEDFLGILEKFDFSDERFANMALFTLENYKVLLQDNESLSSIIKACLDKIPLKEYMRIGAEDSNTQRKIASILVNLGYLIQQEEIIGIYSVDFLLRPKLVLEYHGTSHYYLNRQEMIKLHQVKVRVLQKMGYYVQVIPHFEWSVLEGKQRQETYLNEIIYEPFYKYESR